MDMFSGFPPARTLSSREAEGAVAIARRIEMFLQARRALLDRVRDAVTQ
jgi:hypothetical protein